MYKKKEIGTYHKIALWLLSNTGCVERAADRLSTDFNSATIYASSAASLVPSPSAGTVKSSQTSILCPGGRKREFGSIFISAAIASKAVAGVLVPVPRSAVNIEAEDTSSLPARSN